MPTAAPVDSSAHLSSIRFSTVYRFLLVADFLTETILWIIGAYLHLQTSELDQIVNFQFKQSVFDILLLSSFKALLLFILITELEELTIKIAAERAELVLNRASMSETTPQHHAAEIESLNDVDTENLVNQLIHVQDSRATQNAKMLKRTLHSTLFFLNLFSLVYVSVKFGIVLNAILANKRDGLGLLFNSSLSPTMNYFFFAILAVQLAFDLVQFTMSCFSVRAFRKLGKHILVQYYIESTRVSGENGDAQSGQKKNVNIRRLIGLSYPERFIIMIAFVMLLISSVTNIAVPYFFGLVVDSAVKNPDLVEMNKYIVYMFLVFSMGSIAGGVRSWLFEFAGQRVVARLRMTIFDRIIKKDIKFFDTNRTGELTSRISSDTQVLQNAVTSNFSMLIRYLIQIIGSIVFMFTLEASLTGLLLAIVPIISFMTVLYGRYLRTLRKKFQDELAASSVVAEETISSVRTVRSFAAEAKLLAEYEKNVQKSFNIGKKLAVASGGFMVFIGLLSAGGLALIMWYGGKLVHDQKISTGLLASFLMYTLQVAAAFAVITSLYGDYMQALGASQRIFELMDEKPSIELNKGFYPLNDIDDDTTFNGSLLFDNVCFSYPSRSDSQVLKNITLHIEKGKTLALVGPSGGGKSTIFALIERFYDPESGLIKLGPSNIELKRVNTNWIHSRIALVSQEPVLFGGTIKENIAFGVENTELVDHDRIVEAARLANAHDFIMTFENQYDTVVGERGIRLSGGQKQRIAIARALLMNPKLLLLDEATSALDSESEHLVQEAIERAMKNRTVCVIAHRLSTVRDADRVVVIDQGSIVEEGTHDELCQFEGIYKKFVLRQLLTSGGGGSVDPATSASVNSDQ